MLMFDQRELTESASPSRVSRYASI